MRKWMVAGSAIVIAACAGPAQVEVEEPWVRLPAVAGRPAAAYFTIIGGERADRLIRVTADYAVRAEMHQTLNAGGRMSMRPIAGVDLPAGEEVAFAPGGRHVMLFDLDPRAKPGATTLLTLTFADGRRLQRKARIVAASVAAPD